MGPFPFWKIPELLFFAKTIHFETFDISISHVPVCVGILYYMLYITYYILWIIYYILYIIYCILDYIYYILYIIYYDIIRLVYIYIYIYIISYIAPLRVNVVMSIFLLPWFDCVIYYIAFQLRVLSNRWTIPSPAAWTSVGPVGHLSGPLNIRFMRARYIGNIIFPLLYIGNI